MFIQFSCANLKTNLKAFIWGSWRYFLWGQGNCIIRTDRVLLKFGKDCRQRTRYREQAIPETACHLWIGLVNLCNIYWEEKLKYEIESELADLFELLLQLKPSQWKTEVISNFDSILDRVIYNEWSNFRNLHSRAHLQRHLVKLSQDPELLPVRNH